MCYKTRIYIKRVDAITNGSGAQSKLVFKGSVGFINTEQIDDPVYLPILQ